MQKERRRSTYNNSMQIRSALLKGSEFLRSGLERQILLAAILNVRREYLIAHSENEISVAKVRKFLKWCESRGKGMPIAYLTHSKEFFGLSFYVDERVLIPRPEPELLVEEAIFCAKKFANKLRRNLGEKFSESPTILDVGTGSGCIAVSLAKALPKAKIIASDISKDALRVARKNIKVHEVLSRVKVVQGDLLRPFMNKKIDIVVANLPYVPRVQAGEVETQVKKYEPSIALWGGKDGMKLLNKFFVQLSKMKYAPAYVLGEFGYSMKKDIMRSLKKYLPKSSVIFKKDLEGRDRMFLLYNH